MAHYIAGPDAPPAIRCPRCGKHSQPNGWATVNGQQMPRRGEHIERAFDLPGYGQAWLCHDCAGEALAAVLAYLDALTTEQALDILSGIGDGVALEQALEAAGLSEETTG